MNFLVYHTMYGRPRSMAYMHLCRNNVNAKPQREKECNPKMCSTCQEFVKKLPSFLQNLETLRRICRDFGTFCWTGQPEEWEWAQEKRLFHPCLKSANTHLHIYAHTASSCLETMHIHFERWKLNYAPAKKKGFLPFFSHKSTNYRITACKLTVGNF